MVPVSIDRENSRRLITNSAGGTSFARDRVASFLSSCASWNNNREYQEKRREIESEGLLLLLLLLLFLLLSLLLLII